MASSYTAPSYLASHSLSFSRVLTRVVQVCPTVPSQTLRVLDLGCCEITDEGLVSVRSSMPALRFLNLTFMLQCVPLIEAALPSVPATERQPYSQNTAGGAVW